MVLPAFQPDLTLGALEIGVLIATCLFGATCTQTYVYFRSSRRDAWDMKSLVRVRTFQLCRISNGFSGSGVHRMVSTQQAVAESGQFRSMIISGRLLDLGHTISICHLNYTLTVTDYGQGAASMMVPPVTVDVALLLSALIGPIEQARPRLVDENCLGVDYYSDLVHSPFIHVLQKHLSHRTLCSALPCSIYWKHCAVCGRTAPNQTHRLYNSLRMAAHFCHRHNRR